MGNLKREFSFVYISKENFVIKSIFVLEKIRSLFYIPSLFVFQLFIFYSVDVNVCCLSGVFFVLIYFFNKIKFLL